MTILVIAPNPSAAEQVLASWKPRLTGVDRIHVLSFGAGAAEIQGTHVHHISLDPARSQSLRPRVVRSAGWRLAGSNVHLWDAYLTEIWDEFLWNVRSFDADVIDVRAFSNPRLLIERLRSGPWRVVASSDDASSLTEPKSWRRNSPAAKVSIVLPVYNGEAYLHQSIQSCLEQTHTNLELVVVDDCSTDRSPAIIEEFRRSDSRVVVVRNERNRRLPGALNVGFANTTGDLLSWTSHDNYYAPTAIATLVGYLSTWPDVDFVYSAYRIVDADGRLTTPVYYRGAPWCLPTECVVGPYFLYRRRVYELVGEYREDMEYAEDYDYWVRVYKHGFKMMALPEPLYFYRHHPDSMTAQADKMVERPHSGERVRREHFACP